MGNDAGKGDKQRPCNRRKYDDGYDRIFRKTNIADDKSKDRNRLDKKDGDVK